MPSFLAKALKRNSILDQLDIFLAKKALQEQVSRTELLVDPVGFHPSQIDSCFRAVIYAWCGIPMDSNPPKPKTMRVFHNGDYFHKRMQTYFRDMGILEGNWKCKDCLHEWYGLIKTCPKCLAPAYKQKFKEIPFKKEWIIGASDGIVHFNGRRVVIELKSINSRDFVLLKKPQEHHKKQGNCYMDGLDVEECAFIYENKDTQEIKIFLERRDDKLIKSIYRDIKEFLDKYWNKKILPPRLCENPNWCPYQKECYITKSSFAQLLAHRNLCLQKKGIRNATEKELAKVVGKKNTPLLRAAISFKLNKILKGSSGILDKKPLLTTSAKAHLRKHGGLVSK